MGRESFDQPPADDTTAERDPVTRIMKLLAQLLPEVAGASPARLESIESMIRREYGGSSWRIRKRPPLDKSRVLECFDGRNATAVARQLGISRATVYRVLKQPGRPKR